LAFPYPRLGQKLAQAKGQAQLGPAFFGLAWPGFWPQAKAGTSLDVRDGRAYMWPCVGEVRSMGSDMKKRIITELVVKEK